MLRRAWKFAVGVALSAPPCVLILTGCAFNPPRQSSGVFCDIERGRECATEGDIPMGIDMSRRNEDGFWIGRNAAFGLDYSPQALAQCNGRPQKVLFQGAFPDGSPVCLSDSAFPDGYIFTTAKAACEKWCESHDWIDGDGNKYNCANVAWPSQGSNGLNQLMCTDAGTLSPSYADPRKVPPSLPAVPNPVQWVNTVNVTVTGNSLEKVSGTPVYDAGAAGSVMLLGDGAFEFTAIETDRERMAGFAVGDLPDLDPSNADIRYGIILHVGGTLSVVDSGTVVSTSTYKADDKIRISVLGGITRYFRNGVHLFSGGAPSYPLRVSVSLKDRDLTRGATIRDARISF